MMSNFVNLINGDGVPWVSGLNQNTFLLQIGPSKNFKSHVLSLCSVKIAKAQHPIFLHEKQHTEGSMDSPHESMPQPGPRKTQEVPITQSCLAVNHQSQKKGHWFFKAQKKN